MQLQDELLAIERRLWTNNAAFYEASGLLDPLLRSVEERDQPSYLDVLESSVRIDNNLRDARREIAPDQAVGI